MARLIDADAFVSEMNDRIESAIEWGKNAKDEGIKTRAEQAVATFCEASLTAKKMPTVDAVPVVRCKDCVSYGTSISGVPCEGYCKQLEYTTRKDDDFCSWGRRKNEAD